MRSFSAFRQIYRAVAPALLKMSKFFAVGYLRRMHQALFCCFFANLHFTVHNTLSSEFCGMANIAADIMHVVNSAHQNILYCGTGSKERPIGKVTLPAPWPRADGGCRGR